MNRLSMGIVLIAVAAITWWGLPDGGWLKAPSGFVHADGTPKPSFEALRGLIKGEWWLEPTDLVTDDTGSIRFAGTAGSYSITSDSGEAVVATATGAADGLSEVILQA